MVMLKNKRKHLFALFFAIAVLFAGVFFVGAQSTFADMGPKPSIAVNIEGLNTTDYLVDLFIYAPERYNAELMCSNCTASQDQIKELHDLNFDGWISSKTRSSLLWGDIVGNNKFSNNFSYFGVPKEYKIVIVNNNTNEIKISDRLERQNLNEDVTVNYRDMTTVRRGDMANFVLKMLLVVGLTVLIELGIALLMNIRKWRVIILTNVATNTLLQLAFYLVSLSYFVIFCVGEIMVLLVESLVYCRVIKDIDQKRIILYTFIANLATALLTFVVGGIL